MKKYTFYLIALLFTILTACTNTSKKDLEEVKVMYNIDANNLHFPIAEKQGYFEEFGINVKSSNSAAAKFALDALNAGSVDYSVLVDMNIAHNLFNKNSDESLKNDLVVLAELAEPINAIKLIARKDRGIEKAEDLKGKKIGVLFGVNIHLFLHKYLLDNGIALDEVEMINMAPPNAVSAFKSNGGDSDTQIDAIVIWQPHVYKLQKELGDKVIVLSDEGHKYWYYKMILVTKKEILENNPETAKAILKGLRKADELIQKDENLAIETMANLLYMDVKEVKEFYSEHQYKLQLTDGLYDMIVEDVNWLDTTIHKGSSPIEYKRSTIISNLYNETFKKQ